jgi:hypothetical protein
MVVYHANDTRLIPAAPGTTPELLGMGFTLNFSDRDVSGRRQRVFPPKVVASTENLRRIDYDVITDEAQLEAHGRYLFAQANVAASRQKRYMVVKAFNTKKIVSLDDADAPAVAADYVAQRIHYGWALYMIIEGDDRTFTAGVAAELEKAGGSLKAVADKHNLKVRFHALGLNTKPGTEFGFVSSVNEVEDKYMVGDPVPIFVEYRALRQVASKRVVWLEPKFAPGWYTFTSVSLAIADRKQNGSHWDGLGDPADPVVEVRQYNPANRQWEPLISLSQRNTNNPTFSVGKRIFVTSGTQFYFDVKDKDLVNDDPVGNASCTDLLTFPGAAPAKEISMQTTGQLLRLSVVLTPSG